MEIIVYATRQYAIMDTFVILININVAIHKGMMRARSLAEYPKTTASANAITSHVMKAMYVIKLPANAVFLKRILNPPALPLVAHLKMIYAHVAIPPAIKVRPAFGAIPLSV